MQLGNGDSAGRLFNIVRNQAPRAWVTTSIRPWGPAPVAAAPAFAPAPPPPPPPPPPPVATVVDVLRPPQLPSPVFAPPPEQMVAYAAPVQPVISQFMPSAATNLEPIPDESPTAPPEAKSFIAPLAMIAVGLGALFYFLRRK